MAFKIEYGYYGRYGWFKPIPETGQNPRSYKTANGARKAARAKLMKSTYNWAGADSIVARITFNGSDYGEMEQSIKGKRRFISWKGTESSAGYEVAENGSLI